MLSILHSIQCSVQFQSAISLNYKVSHNISSICIYFHLSFFHYSQSISRNHFVQSTHSINRLIHYANATLIMNNVYAFFSINLFTFTFNSNTGFSINSFQLWQSISQIQLSVTNTLRILLIDVVKVKWLTHRQSVRHCYMPHAAATQPFSLLSLSLLLLPETELTNKQSEEERV